MRLSKTKVSLYLSVVLDNEKSHDEAVELTLNVCTFISIYIL